MPIDHLAAGRSPQWAVRCGATTRRGGKCKRHDLGAGGRCPYHGGMSTGPRTEEGRARALLNLVQFRTASA